jgi:hypothetical protein
LVEESVSPYIAESSDSRDGGGAGGPGPDEAADSGRGVGGVGAVDEGDTDCIGGCGEEMLSDTVSYNGDCRPKCSKFI